MRLDNMLAFLLATFFSLTITVTALPTGDAVAADSASNTLRTVGYFVDWAPYGRKFQPQDLNDTASQFTHILYAFANTRADTGEVTLADGWADTDAHWESEPWTEGNNLYGCAKQLYQLKKANRKLKVLLSIGGWTYSTSLSQGASTDAGRQTFAQSAVKIIGDLGFDGLDIDWEFPNAPPSDAEAANLVALLQTLRAALDQYSTNHANGYHLQLTYAAPAGPQNYGKLRLADMDKYLDFWNLMSYDYAGSWDTKSGFSSNLYPSTQNPAATPFSTDQAVRDYITGGVPANKIILGNPIYGRSFQQTTGPGAPFSGVGAGSWESGSWDYKALPKAGAQLNYDDTAVASWSYDPSTQEMISYDTPDVARKKAQYVMEKGLGGAMWWETSADKIGADSLVGATVDAFGGEGNLDSSQNLLDYPISKYDNLRNGQI